MAKIRKSKRTSGYGINNVGLVTFLALVLVCVLSGVCYADSAEVLPKGIFGVYFNANFYRPIDKRYDDDHDEEPIAQDYNANLNSQVFPALGLVEAGFGMPAGSASIGTGDVTFEYNFNIYELIGTYGLTDKLMAVVLIPYWDFKNNVNARLNTANATVGSNPFFGLPGDPFGAPIIPTTFGGVPLTTDQVQQLLGPGLDFNGDGNIDIPGYGFKRVESFSESGISDIEAGLRYQYYKSDKWRLAFTGGIRFPTGDVDDPDSLVDYPFGGGAWGLLFQLQNDYLGINNMVLNATFRYDLLLPHHQVVRVPDDVNQPITLNRDEVDIDRGDKIELEAQATYQFLQGLSGSLLYQFGYKMRDNVTGDKPFRYESLEDETRAIEHVGIVSLSYSTIPLVRAKKFSIPLTARISYRNRFAGKNALKSEYIGVLLTVFF